MDSSKFWYYDANRKLQKGRYNRSWKNRKITQIQIILKTLDKLWIDLNLAKKIRITIKIKKSILKFK